MRHSKRLYGAAVVGAITAPLETSIAIGDVPTSPESNAPPATAVPAPPAARGLALAVSARQSAAFGAFRRAPAGDDAAPASAQRFMAAALVSRYGVNPGLSRRGASAGKAGDVYLVSGNGVLCTIAVLDAGTGGGCVDEDDAVAGHLVGTDSWQDSLGGPEHVVVSGAVPDGVDNVTVTTKDGGSVNAGVQSNVYAAELVGQAPSSVSWQAADGTKHVEEVPYQEG